MWQGINFPGRMNTEIPSGMGERKQRREGGKERESKRPFVPKFGLGCQTKAMRKTEKVLECVFSCLS